MSAPDATPRLNAAVLQVVPELDAGGAERTTVEIARAIVEAGGRAIVASRGGRLEGELKAAGGELVRMPAHSKNPLVMWSNRGRLIDVVRSEGVDIVHARSRAPAWSALAAARATGARYVATYHGVYAAKTPWKRAYNGVMARGDVVIANSDYTRDHVRLEHGTDPARIVAIPRGADLARFDPERVSPDRVAAVRASWGLSPGDRPFLVLLPGRLTAWKGQSVLVEAARILVERGAASGVGDDLSIILAGDAQGRTDYETDLRTRIAEAGLDGMAKTPGHCDDMPAAYAAADVVVSASTRPEAFGRVAVEAQAMGRPVIASDHGGSRETVEAGVAGFLTPPGDALALADAIETLAKAGPGARAAMGAAGRARVEARYSTAAMCAATLDVYRDLLARA